MQSVKHLIRKMDLKMLKSKIRGSMLGGLAGDCCGAPFEGEDYLESAGSKLVLKKNFDTLEGPTFRAPKKPYTDDTAMSMCVAQTLILHRDINQTDLARNFVVEYFKNPRRGYGGAVTEVFRKLRATKFEDPTGPAIEQFDGTGSYGNGGAMRVAPIPLFCHNKPTERLIELVKKSTEITHTHQQAIDGAILQALAIYFALHSDATKELDINGFVNFLKGKMNEIETDTEGLGLDEPKPYSKQLLHVERLIEQSMLPSDEEIVNVLGHSVAALYSVPTAIYCFLRAQKDFAGLEGRNKFRCAIEYAISLGGDTDTIASMAGSISGAYHGDDLLSKNLLDHCEGFSEVSSLANELCEASLLENDSS